MKKLGVIFVLLLLLCGCGQNQPPAGTDPMATMVLPQTEQVQQKEEREKPEVKEQEDRVQPQEEQPQEDPSQPEAELEEVQEEVMNQPTCTIAIDCKTVLGNIEKLVEEKREWVPKNGVILPPTTVEITEGDTAFSVLNRIAREKKIPLEFVETPMYQSAYIEGIGNLYEFDCGESSGWLYLVNGRSLSYGCSQYQVKNGDVIAFRYTLNFGKDIV